MRAAPNIFLCGSGGNYKKREWERREEKGGEGRKRKHHKVRFVKVVIFCLEFFIF